MKATTWFCQLFLFLCAIHVGYATQRANYPISYPWDYMASNFITEENLMLKRNAPSLSIVNPLDVLRKRLLLEMARRQMKENTRQVELNRTILKNVGKRIYRNQSTALDPYEYMTALDSRGQEKLSTYQPHTHPNRYLIPATLIFDYMKRHSPDEYKSTAIPTPLLDKKNTPMYNLQSAGEEDIEMNVSSASESSIDDSDDDGFSIVSDGRKTFAISTITDQQ